MSAAFAPEYAVTTLTYGISISGNWSIAKLFSENNPNVITPMKINIVDTGFFTAI
jgi:hypothetical protein